MQLTDDARSMLVLAAYLQLVGGEPVKKVALDDDAGHDRRQEADMTEPKESPESDAARTEEGQADENRGALKEKAEECFKDTVDELPEDQI
jgi:hypothetical protein